MQLIQVHALRYPVAQQAQTAEKTSQRPVSAPQPETRGVTTPPPSANAGRASPPNSSEDDRFFTPQTTRRPPRRPSPSSPAEEILAGHLPKPLSIPAMAAERRQVPDENVDISLTNTVQDNEIREAHFAPATPTTSTDKPSLWNRFRDFWQDPEMQPDVLKTPSANQRSTQPPHSVTFSSDGEITVFSPARERRYHATPQVLDKHELSYSPTTEGDETSRDGSVA